ncbi:MAG: HAMP domain-containing protein [Candidatus Aureabacteria bacterium]|nr:HAMP domain-containing protein [Candidatus Auribacterota bacterium]
MSRKESFRSKLVRLLVIIGLLPLVVFFYFSSIKVKAILIDKTGVSLQKTAREKSMRIGYIIDDKIIIAEKIIEDKELKREFLNKLNPSSGESVESGFSNDLLDILHLHREILNIAFIDSAGRVFFESRHERTIHDSLKKWWKDSEEKRASGETFLSDLLFFPERMKITANIVVPVHGESGRLEGFIVFNMNFKEIIYLIWRVDPFDPHVTFFRNDGFVLLDTSDVFYPLIVTREFLVETFLKKNSWRKGLARAQKTNIILGYSSLDQLNEFLCGSDKYYLMVFNDENEVLWPVLKSYFQSFIIIFLIIFVIILSAFFDVRKMTRPLLALKKGTEMIGQEDFDYRVKIETGDEIEELGDAFNQMSEKLKISKSRLEAQNRELLQLNEIKSNFLSLVSHELRTPLMIIQESVSQILDGLKGPVSPEQEEFLSMSKRNIQRLNKIIDDLLSISKIEAGKMILRRRKVDIVKAIREEVAIYRYRAKDKGIEFSMNIPDEAILLYCDEDKLKIIVANLASNAIKFTPLGGEIHLELKDHINEIELVVSDTGQGIPPEFHEKIFEKFEKLNHVPLTGVASTGLGLAIAREFVLLHKGRIWVESEEGRGSRFHVVFPKYTENKYFKEFFTEKIKQAQHRHTDLSILILRLSAYERVYVDVMKKRKLFSHMINISFNHIFDYEEIIPLKNMDEIYAFLFTDEKGAEIIVDRLNSILNDYLEQKKLKETFLVNILAISYPEDGQDPKSLLRTAGNLFHYLDPLKKKTKMLGELLVEKGLLQEDDLQRALRKQAGTGDLLGKILIDDKTVSAEILAQVLSEQLGIPLVNIENLDVKEKKLFEILPKDFIIKYKTFPVSLREKILTLALVNPFDINAIKKAYRMTGSQTIIIQLILMHDFNSLTRESGLSGE